MSNELWTVKSANDYFLKLVDSNGFEVSVTVKLDGCVDYFNEDSYLHMCHIDTEIKRLLQIRRLAKKHFGREWGVL